MEKVKNQLCIQFVAFDDETFKGQAQTTHILPPVACPLTNKTCH